MATIAGTLVTSQTLMLRLDTSVDQASALLQTMERFNSACNFLVGKGRYTNKLELQKIAYREIRERFGLGAQGAIRAIGKVVEVWKQCGKRPGEMPPTFKLRGAIQYDQRNLSWKRADRVSISSLGGRLAVPIRLGEYQKQCLNGRSVRGQTDMIYRSGVFYLGVVVNVPNETPYEPKSVIGVDFGIENLATDSSGQNFNGKKIDEARRGYSSLRARLQSRGTKSAKRHLKRLSGRERRFKRDANHGIAKAVVAKAKRTESLIALEDLRGIRERTRVRRGQRERQNRWSFAQLRAFVEYKARRAGVTVAVVDPRNTSRHCPVCHFTHKKNRPTRNLFKCIYCGFSGPADWVAAVNIAGRAAVNQPIVAPPLAAASPLPQGVGN